MRAIAYHQAGVLDRPDALVDVELPRPVAAGRDLLVAVQAVSVNPVDTKVRAGAPPFEGRAERILGWDAAGIVEAVGPDVTRFKVGDPVFYAGNIARDGSNAQYQLVDERIVGRAPSTLSVAEAAALPLTAITAWEALFDRLRVQDKVGQEPANLLIIGGAGGVGSVAIQIARAGTDLTVIATASRPETQDWVRGLGAHHVIDHSQPMAPQIAALGLDAPAFVFSTTHTDHHLADIAELIAPQGRFALIDDPASLDIIAFKRKAVSVHWELMFTRSLFDTPDVAEQGRLLDEVAKLVDQGAIRTTLTQTLSPINAANLIAAHRQIESATTRGKIVLEGWQHE
ncbi:zinc-binding alcohol dehydrogenase family protein (plasmid) [Novosphingobium resinovorum]|uniref:Zinc-type alcohol dehydrogenase-like protein n=1 Tax=Novosphingobium resinovorum TaxID=158500 RepID=A0A031JG38_9SPHN|nr:MULTISPECIES: zinc-binding alcohol dehydrogenase family protein [Novosphingobium]EZP72146.1 NADPH:quinone reductase [Novosphingobium resinovorum]MBF7015231.1 zinc-binding alcohol dehydrogenase family protein [Novosphingobium sp. HR1a]WJM29910.1 zinc-binding alcohol dehydrogenase family protein [Novosphingobium resinovorum]